MHKNRLPVHQDFGVFVGHIMLYLGVRLLKMKALRGGYSSPSVIVLVRSGDFVLFCKTVGMS